jgi:hypothetical protein
VIFEDDLRVLPGEEGRFDEYDEGLPEDDGEPVEDDYGADSFP